MPDRFRIVKAARWLFMLSRPPSVLLGQVQTLSNTPQGFKFHFP